MVFSAMVGEQWKWLLLPVCCSFPPENLIPVRQPPMVQVSYKKLFAGLIKEKEGINIDRIPGAGIAGGLGAGLMAF